MIVIDIETTGLNPEKNGIWQVGGLDFKNPGETFLDECRIDDSDAVTEGAFRIHQKNEEYVRDRSKQSQHSLLSKFFEWYKERDSGIFISQNPQAVDYSFLRARALRYGLELPFHYRGIDLHTLAVVKYHEVHKRFLIENGHSGMGLSRVLDFCGLEDKRGAHNALTDARLTAECFSRLMFGKNLLEEYSDYKIPVYLRGKQ